MDSKSEFFERESSEPLFRLRGVPRSEDGSWRVTVEVGDEEVAAPWGEFTLDCGGADVPRPDMLVRFRWIPPEK